MKKIILIAALFGTSCTSIDINLFGTHNKIVVNKTINNSGDDNKTEMIGASLADLAKGNKQEGGKADIKLPVTP